VDASDGFSIGSTVVIDTYPKVFDPANPLVQESRRITDIPDKNHITVEALTHAHNETPFPIIQLGEEGILISEWCVLAQGL
jgi:hypothetical protein